MHNFINKKLSINQLLSGIVIGVSLVDIVNEINVLNSLINLLMNEVY